MVFLRSAVFILCGAIGLACVASQALAEAPTRAEPGAAPAVKQIKKWNTDEAVRKGMENIRQAFAANQESINTNHFGAQDYQRLADEVDKNLAGIAAGSKLPKETDVALHTIVLVDLGQSSELMRKAPKIQGQRTGALGVMQSLRNYGKYFEHPGWAK